MPHEWRLTERQSHAIFVALLANANNAYVKKYSTPNTIAIWLEALKGMVRLRAAPAEIDKKLFPVLIEQELIRLAKFEAEYRLPCGCRVFEHRRALQRFRLKNLS